MICLLHGPTVMLLMNCYIRNKFCLNQMIRRKILEHFYLFFFCQKFCITLFIHSLVQNATVGSWIYSELNFEKL